MASLKIVIPETARRIFAAFQSVVNDNNELQRANRKLRAENLQLKADLEIVNLKARHGCIDFRCSLCDGKKDNDK